MTTIREMYGLGDIQPYKVALPATITSPYTVKSQEMIGIEVEIENVAHMLVGGLNKAWGQDGDGSLRNNGMEFITKPILASSSPVLLEYLFNVYLPKQSCFSPRTSVHVHLNMLDCSSNQVTDLVLLYALFERLFYKFAGRGRAKNIYCVPLVETDLLAGLCELQPHRTGWSKYVGLNILCLQTYGTVEFRHMHGTADIEKLSIWINLITALKEYVKATNSKDIRTAIIQMDDDYGYDELLSSIFGEFAKYLKFEHLSEISYNSVKQAITSKTTVKRQIDMAKRESLFYSFKG